MILAMINLSIEMWNTTMMLAEINEETEHVPSSGLGSGEVAKYHYAISHADDNMARSFHHLHSDQFADGCDFFEIQSPPPELAVNQVG